MVRIGDRKCASYARNCKRWRVAGSIVRVCACEGYKGENERNKMREAETRRETVGNEKQCVECIIG